MAEFLKPKTITVKDMDGAERTYTISRFDAVAGREIMLGYPLSSMPKIGDYRANEQLMFKLMSYVGIEVNNNLIPFSTPDLYRNHVPDWETGMQIEAAIIEYNSSFFLREKLSNFLENTTLKILEKVTETLTVLSGQLSVKEKPPSTN